MGKPQGAGCKEEDSPEGNLHPEGHKNRSCSRQESVQSGITVGGGQQAEGEVGLRGYNAMFRSPDDERESSGGKRRFDDGGTLKLRKEHWVRGRGAQRRCRGKVRKAMRELGRCN